MDQAKGAGHHVITRTAVQNLFASGHVVNGLVLGMGEEDFANALDDAQAYMDRWYGPTVLPWWAAPDAQRQHAMARGDRSGEWNLEADQSWVQDNAVQALIAAQNGNVKDAMSALGASVHALEDSYSEAHEFRDQSEHSGNPYAAVESINVFDPTGAEGGGGVFGSLEGTHDPHFDVVPEDSHGGIIEGDDHAAVNAVTLLLEQFVAEQSASIDQARTELDGLVSKFFQSAAAGTTVNEHPDAAFMAEDQQRRAVDDAQVAAANTYTPGDVEFFGQISFDPNPPAAGTDFTISWQEQNKGGYAQAGTTKLHYFDTNDASNAYDVEIPVAGINANDMAQRSYTVSGGIPGGSVWRFELALDPDVSDWDGTLSGEIQATGSSTPNPSASSAPQSSASPAPSAARPAASSTAGGTPPGTGSAASTTSTDTGTTPSSAPGTSAASPSP